MRSPTAGGDVEVLGLGRSDSAAAPAASAPGRSSGGCPPTCPHSHWGSLASSLPHIAYRCRTAGMQGILDKLLKRGGWDGIVFDGISTGWALPQVLDHYAGRGDRPRLIYVSHNHEESLRTQIAESQPLFLKRQAVRFDALKVSRLERELVDAVDFVTAITHGGPQALSAPALRQADGRADPGLLRPAARRTARSRARCRAAP